MHLYVYVCICVYMYVFVCICMYMYVYVCICMYMYVCICMYMYVYACVCIYSHWFCCIVQKVFNMRLEATICDPAFFSHCVAIRFSFSVSQPLELDSNPRLAYRYSSLVAVRSTNLSLASMQIREKYGGRETRKKKWTRLCVEPVSSASYT